MCEFGARLWQRGLIGAAEGNISVRLPDGTILCTPSGVSKGHLVPEQLVVIDAAGAPLRGGAPSTEIRLHVRALAKRPDCKAVVHAHPPVATAFSVAERGIPDNVLPEAAYMLGPVALVPFSMPGTDEVPDRLEPFLANHKTFLLSHHGAATLGDSIEDAYNRMETLERVATVLLTAELLGGPRPMPSAAFDLVQAQLLHGRLS